MVSFNEKVFRCSACSMPSHMYSNALYAGDGGSNDTYGNVIEVCVWSRTLLSSAGYHYAAARQSGQLCHRAGGTMGTPTAKNATSIYDSVAS